VVLHHRVRLTVIPSCFASAEWRIVPKCCWAECGDDSQWWADTILFGSSEGWKPWCAAKVGNRVCGECDRGGLSCAIVFVCGRRVLFGCTAWW
jgi:hypothetical protein